MNHRLAPTPFTDVNFVLDHFRSQLQALLDSELVGIYLVGSLALGDFNPRSSDIDFVVVTSTEIDPDRFTALQHVHAQFAASNSPWASFIEQSLTKHHGSGNISQGEENTTLAFLAFILEEIQRSAAAIRSRTQNAS